MAHSTDKQANCPLCHQVSNRPHVYYYRQPTDLSVSDKPVQIRLRLRRFRCLNPACLKRTFGQPCPDWLPTPVEPVGWLSRGGGPPQCRVAMMLGGQAACRLLTHLYMSTSRDTLLRLIRKWRPSVWKTPRALGVDDCRAAVAGHTKSEDIRHNFSQSGSTLAL